MNIINNAQNLGTLSKDLILNTLGRVYVRAGDRYYELNFQNSVVGTSENEDKSESSGVVYDSLPAEYPGDNQFIVLTNGSFYITQNGTYQDVTPKVVQSTTADKTETTVTASEDASELDKLYSDKLQLDFKAGSITAEEVTIDKLNVNEIEAGSIDVSQTDRQVYGIKKLYLSPELTVTDVDQDEGMVVFELDDVEENDLALFKVGSVVTNQNDEFRAEITEVDESEIRGKLTEGNAWNTTKLILVGDYIEFNQQSGSTFNLQEIMSMGSIAASGDYSGLEFATIGSDVQITVKAGLLLKCINDCNITFNVDSSSFTCKLYKNTLYIVSSNTCINLSNTIRIVQSTSEVTEDSLNIIKDTNQLYYDGVYIGGEQEAKLPSDFNLNDAYDGAVIARKNGIWIPSSDYATYSYVDDKIKELVNKAPDTMDTLGEIAAIITQLEELKSKVSELESKLT